MPRKQLFVAVVLVLIALPALPSVAMALETVQDGLLVRIWLSTQPDDLVRLAAARLTPIARQAAPQPYVLARTDKAGAGWLAANGFRFQVLDDAAASARYLMVDLAGPPWDAPAGRLVFADGQRAVWRIDAGRLPEDIGPSAWWLDHSIRLEPRPAPALPATVTPIPLVQEIIDQVDLPRLMFNANELSGAQATTINGAPYTIVTRHTGGTPPASSFQAVNYMVERLQRLGLSVTTHTWDASKPPNVIAEKPGLYPSLAGIYIICAHLDDMPSGTLAPGADDNGSGSVAVLHAAEILSAYNFDATVRFILFTGEEQGLYGSAAYAQMVQNQDIRGVLNMDMIAWDNQGGPNMDLHADSTVAGSVESAQVFADAVTAYSINLIPVVYPNGIGASDHSSFWDVGIPAFLAIENYTADTGAPRDFNAYYHTTGDRVQYYNQTFFDNMVKASLAAFAHMAGIHTTCYWADLNCDGQVTAVDITREAGHWLAAAGQWNYSRAYDANDDGVINIVDIQRVAAEWGWAGP